MSFSSSGLSAGLLRQIFYTTSRLGLFEVFRDEMAKYRPTDIWSRLSTGMVSGGRYYYIIIQYFIILYQ